MYCKTSNVRSRIIPLILRKRRNFSGRAIYFPYRLHTDKPKNPIFICIEYFMVGSICAPDFDVLQYFCILEVQYTKFNFATDKYCSNYILNLSIASIHSCIERFMGQNRQKLPLNDRLNMCGIQWRAQYQTACAVRG